MRYLLKYKLLMAFFVFAILSESLFGQAPGVMPRTKTEFLQIANDRDSLVALTELFFLRRREGNIALTAAGGTMVLLPLVMAGSAIGTGLSGGSDPTDKLQAAAVVGGMVIYAGLIVGIRNKIKFSRNRLYQVMIDYDPEVGLPPRLRSKTSLPPR